MGAAIVFEQIGGILGSSFERAPWGYGILALMITAIVKLRPIMAKLAAERESNLLKARADDNAALKLRVDKLEKLIDAERIRHDAERQLDRHRINNLNACLDAIFLLFEAAPEKAAHHVQRVKEMREKQLRAEQDEKTAITTAALTAANEIAAMHADAAAEAGID